MHAYCYKMAPFLPFQTETPKGKGSVRPETSALEVVKERMNVYEKDECGAR
jgi:hypothetical protein